MQSFLLFGPDNKKQHAFIDTFCIKEKIGTFDRQQFSTEDTSFGIQDVRDIQKAAMRKPSRADKKVLVIMQAELLTLDAQNALLKLLEEPPLGTTIFLCATSAMSFLPTVLSRCRIVHLGEKESLSEERKKELLTLLALAYKGNITDSLVFAETLSNKKIELPNTLEELLETGRERLLENPKDIRLADILTTLQKAYHISQTTNVAPRMILEHMLLSISL